MAWARYLASSRLAPSLLHPHGPRYRLSPRHYSAVKDNKRLVTIGSVSKPVSAPAHPELVPKNYLPAEIPRETMKDLKWMMQKDLLGQDIFLLGRPGPLRRQLAQQYLELTDREMEYVSLSRDTTESDIKQRREISSGTANYIDQAAVMAAVHGRILVLEGIEKAERNVLPVLNNLLENREMHLEDGRLLIPAARYDRLLEENGAEVLDRWRLVRVSEDFRVIALGLPVPRYTGSPLDPPLRSRFQARDVRHLPFPQQLEVITEAAPNVDRDLLARLLSFCHTLLTEESAGLGLPDFPMENLHKGVAVLNSVPELEAANVVNGLYPYKLFLPSEGRKSVEDTMETFQIQQGKKPPRLLVESVKLKLEQNVNPFMEFKVNSDKFTGEVELNVGGKIRRLVVPAGGVATTPSEGYVSTPYHKQLLAEMVLAHSVGDVCLVGPKGCGKSAMVDQLANLLGYKMETVQLYQDMTARDLLQQRTTTSTGDTVWRLSPLVEAALAGKMAVLDGLHRLHRGTMAVLQRLLHDRELQLYDGTRLIGQDKYELIKSEHGLTDEDMVVRRVLPIHPAFRLMAIAEPPTIGTASGQWLSPEVLAMFVFQNMRPLKQNEEAEVLSSVTEAGDMGDTLLDVLRLTHKLRKAEDKSLSSISTSLSTRQLLRVAKRLERFPGEDAYSVVHKACLARFLPSLPKEGLDKVMDSLGIRPPDVKSAPEISCMVNDGHLTIGNTTASLYNPETQSKVPETLFYDTNQNLAVMEAMLQDFLLGEHLLLIGNQGTGKNKLVDRLLQLLNKPREYIQLHRDTTVQTLTLQPTVRSGVLVYDDSPLVKAVKTGDILVVDEADKAPTNVTCILKSLVESGEMILSDGRRIVPPYSKEIGPNIINMHKDFRMFVLANRPGFPFLGNDFFGSLGDLFCVHAVDNPSMESELTMLKQYGPNVPEDVMRRLVRAFSDLRAMADEGTIHYPYSTREVVNIIKHLERFPDDGLGNIVRNVFDFDSYSKEVKESLTEVLHKHGIPLGTSQREIKLAKELSLPPKQTLGTWEISRQTKSSGSFLRLPYEHAQIKVGSPQEVNVTSMPLDRTEARGVGFSELHSHWSLPFHDFAVVGDVATFKDKHSRPLYDTIHVLTSNPVFLYSMQTISDKCQAMTLNHFFDARKHNVIARPRMVPLGGKYAGCLAVHDEVTNGMVLVEPESGAVLQVQLNSMFDSMTNFVSEKFVGAKEKKPDFMRMCPDFAAENKLLLYTPKGRTMQMVDLEEGASFKLNLPFVMKSLHPLSPDQYLVVVESHLEPSDIEKPLLYLLKKKDATDPVPTILTPISQTTDISSILALDKRGLSDFGLKLALKEKVSTPNTVFMTPGSYANIAMGFPELEFSENPVVSWPRIKEETSGGNNGPSSNSRGNMNVMKKYLDPGKDFVFLKKSCQIVRPVPVSDVPRIGVQDHVATGSCAAFLEVVDLISDVVRYIPVPAAGVQSPYSAWYRQTYPDNVLGISDMSNDGLVTVDNSGSVRLWETGVANLERSLAEWRKMVGGDDDLTMTIKRDSGLDVDSPKHGKIDEKNDPHVGGNTWAGGTGGRDTAGLGGKGGPYRLDAGHDVHQISDEEKEAVPEQVQKAARDMNRKAFAERLREIRMSEYDAQLYEQYASSVRRQVQSLRTILNSLQAKAKDRTWLKNQTSGELDDTRLIEGLTGEKAIYKKRGEQEPELGAPQEKPKRLKLVVDVSGSMYRFNGHDQRLERMMESALMVMEAFEGYGDRFKYDIVGHSGEEDNLSFVGPLKPPANEKDRLTVLKEMSAHSQYCFSGDHTLSATVHAINELGQVSDQHDDSIVIVLSDANFDRYGIRPEQFSKILNRNEEVNAYAIFIGTLGDQASTLAKKLPSGKGFVCLDTKKLPEILQTIFTSSMLK